ncbi:MAG: hypothetical protein BWX86_02884 [Verrucomicrobia bacterium ADurb.Bin122]|nr:MAG: hypothetical protein BWX86_02884 [Verrucomicrobia bacterium ADurb.Bin122]
MSMPNQVPLQKPVPLCNSTTRTRLIEASWPGALIQSSTGTTESVSESSYEMSCAEARTLPRNGYFELEAQPARITEYTPSEPTASTASRPMSTLTSMSGRIALTAASQYAPKGTKVTVENAGMSATMGAAT